MSWINYTMIVAAQDANLARALAGGLAPDTDTDGMWRTPLSPTGELPATHFVSSGLIQEEFAAMLGDVEATFDAAGGLVPLAAIEGLYGRSTVIGPTREVQGEDGPITVTTDPMQVIAEAGLKLISEKL